MINSILNILSFKAFIARSDDPLTHFSKKVGGEEFVLATTLKAILCQVLVKAREGGRLAVREILLTSDGVSSYIRQKDLQGVRRAIESGYSEFGMQNWQKAAELLHRQGLIDDEVKKQIIAMGA